MDFVPHSLFGGFAGIRVLVVGYVMLDRFAHGRTDRMSPEAPLPVLAATHEDPMAGGKGNVVRNIASLGGSAHIVAITGDDRAGTHLRNVLSGDRRITAGLITLKGRCTTETTQFISERQQLPRVEEDSGPVTEASVTDALAVRLDWADIVILSDYAKGLLTDAFLKEAIAKIHAAGKKIVADLKSANVKRYDGVFLLTPKRREAARASGIAGEDDEDCARAAAVMLQAGPGIEAVPVTRGSCGMTLVARDARPVHFPTAAREAFDVSGAEDTVVATLALALGVGYSPGEAATLANRAAALAVAKAGTATVNFDELVGKLEENTVNLVVLFAEDTPIELITAIRPDVLVKGAGYRADQVTGGDFVARHGGQLALVELISGQSTTGVIAKM